VQQVSLVRLEQLERRASVPRERQAQLDQLVLLVQSLVPLTKSFTRMVQTTLLVVLVLHMTEQTLLLVGKSVLLHQRVMKVENFS
jgi:hypothetical protein